MFDHEQMERAEQRYEACADERTDTDACIAHGDILEADTPERVRLRLERKGLPPEMVSAVMRREGRKDAATRAVIAPVPSGPELKRPRAHHRHL